MSRIVQQLCAGGFATTYTVISNYADADGMEHFERMHEAFIHRASERTNAALLEALKHAVAHLETMAKPTEEYMHHFHAAIAEAESQKENGNG